MRPYQEPVARKFARRAKSSEAKTNIIILNPFEPIHILLFLFLFKLVRDTHDAQEGESMWLLPFFMKKQGAATLDSRFSLRFRSSRKRQKEGTLTTYWEEVIYMLETYATDNIIAETDSKIMRFS